MRAMEAGREEVRSEGRGVEGRREERVVREVSSQR